jgi:hypothetical protein
MCACRVASTPAARYFWFRCIPQYYEAVFSVLVAGKTAMQPLGHWKLSSLCAL